MVAATAARLQLRPPATVRSRFYLRLLVDDRPGVLADVARVLARAPDQHRVGDPARGAGRARRATRVPLVIMTHTALTGDFRAAAAEIDRLGCVAAPSVYYPVAD